MGVTSVTDSNFDAEVLKSDRPVLVDFWAEWCGPCRMLAPVIESISEKYSSQLKVVKLDTDENQVTAQESEITGIPCCILFKDGSEIARFTGYRPLAAFEAELIKHIG